MYWNLEWLLTSPPHSHRLLSRLRAINFLLIWTYPIIHGDQVKLTFFTAMVVILMLLLGRGSLFLRHLYFDLGSVLDVDALFCEIFEVKVKLYHQPFGLSIR